jgi:hypothetical protein
MGVALSIVAYSPVPLLRSVGTGVTARRSGTGSQLSNLPANPARRTSYVRCPDLPATTVESQQSAGICPGRNVNGASGTTSSLMAASSAVRVM